MQTGESSLNEPIINAKNYHVSTRSSMLTSATSTGKSADKSFSIWSVDRVKSCDVEMDDNDSETNLYDERINRLRPNVSDRSRMSTQLDESS